MILGTPERLLKLLKQVRNASLRVVKLIQPHIIAIAKKIETESQETIFTMTTLVILMMSCGPDTGETKDNKENSGALMKLQGKGMMPLGRLTMATGTSLLSRDAEGSIGNCN
jgi:hypothetical protein